MTDQEKNKEREIEKRPVDFLTEEVEPLMSQNFVWVPKKKFFSWKIIATLVFVFGVFGGSVWVYQKDWGEFSRAGQDDKPTEEFVYVSNYKYDYVETPRMELMKTKGCVADGVLTGYGGDTQNTVELLERSQCRYLHRSVETWAEPPNFDLIRENLARFKRNDFIFGMFLAEALNPKAKYHFPQENRNFKFSKMCKKGSEGFWGPKTCKADLGSSEYRKYLRYITERAIDAGIEDFLFGQIYFQETSPARAPEILEHMRSYAHSKGKSITIGAQTNTISKDEYLKLFDYIEGGVGQNEKGELDKTQCASRYLTKWNWCWALLWNAPYAKSAHNIILHFDWSGAEWDDMSIFARMDPETRVKTAAKLHEYFTEKNIGFLLPFLAVIDKENPGCYGPQKGFYSPDNDYSCRDEEAFNAILSGSENHNEKIKTNDARFIFQDVPRKMISGKEYYFSVKMKNTGQNPWTREYDYRLGSQNPQDNNFFGGRVNLEKGEFVQPGEEKVFYFKAKAPKDPGVYNFQWRMVQENVEWFGETSENVEIVVEQ